MMQFIVEISNYAEREARFRQLGFYDQIKQWLEKQEMFKLVKEDPECSFVIEGDDIVLCDLRIAVHSAVHTIGCGFAKNSQDKAYRIEKGVNKPFVFDFAKTIPLNNEYHYFADDSGSKPIDHVNCFVKFDVIVAQY